MKLKKNICIILFVVIFPVVAINLYFDPANFFKTHNDYIKFADSLNSGLNIVGLEDRNERLLTRYRIERRSKFPNTIIIGSSRSMLISSNLLNRDIMNLGVSGGSIEDILAFSNLLLEKPVSMDTLILEIYPWLFNKYSNQNSWIENEHLLPNYQRHSFDFYKIKAEKFLSVIDPSYFKLSSRKMLSTFLYGSQNYYFTKSDSSKRSIIFHDGSIKYDVAYTVHDADELINQFLHTRPFYSFDQYTELDPLIVYEFTSVVKQLSQKFKKIYFFKAPYPPEIEYAFYKGKNSEIVAKVDKALAKVAYDYNITMLGSYKSSTFGLGNEDFYDGMHCKEYVIKNILAEDF